MTDSTFTKVRMPFSNENIMWIFWTSYRYEYHKKYLLVKFRLSKHTFHSSIKASSRSNSKQKFSTRIILKRRNKNHHTTIIQAAIIFHLPFPISRKYINPSTLPKNKLDFHQECLPRSRHFPGLFPYPVICVWGYIYVTSRRVTV